MKMKSVATPFLFIIIIIIIYFSFCVCVCAGSPLPTTWLKSLPPSPPSLNRTLFWFHLVFFSSSSSFVVFFIKFQPMMNRCRDSLFNEWLDDISAKRIFYFLDNRVGGSCCCSTHESLNHLFLSLINRRRRTTTVEKSPPAQPSFPSARAKEDQ